MKGEQVLKKYLKSPIFLILVLMFIMNALDGDFSDIGGWLVSKLTLIPAIVIGVTFHEFAHGFVSHLFGDPTPKNQGRLTINPLAHIDPFGFVALFLAGFGWGVPVQIDPRYYKHRRLGEIAVGFAGVATNLVIAIIFSFIVKFVLMSGVSQDSVVVATLIDILINVVLINIVLMVFNLIPVPPLDGFGIITQIFKLDRYDWWYKVYDMGFVILLILVFLNITNIILTPAVSAIFNLLVKMIIL